MVAEVDSAHRLGVGWDLDAGSVDKVEVALRLETASGDDRGGVVMGAHLLDLALAAVLARQVEADRADAQEEEQAAQEEEEDAADPDRLRLERRAAPDHQEEAQDEDEAGQTAAEQAQTEVPTRRALVQVAVVVRVAGVRAGSLVQRHHPRWTPEADVGWVRVLGGCGGRQVEGGSIRRLSEVRGVRYALARAASKSTVALLQHRAGRGDRCLAKRRLQPMQLMQLIL